MRCSQPIATPPLFFSLALLTSQTLAADFTGEVMDLSDSDTITALHNSLGERIRLNGIDCPEKRQGFGRLAWQFTSNLIFGKTVTMRDHGRDRSGAPLVVG